MSAEPRDLAADAASHGRGSVANDGGNPKRRSIRINR
jgi:hypothetical protein